MNIFQRHLLTRWLVYVFFKGREKNFELDALLGNTFK